MGRGTVTSTKESQGVQLNKRAILSSRDVSFPVVV